GRAGAWNRWNTTGGIGGVGERYAIRGLPGTGNERRVFDLQRIFGSACEFRGAKGNRDGDRPEGVGRGGFGWNGAGGGNAVAPGFSGSAGESGGIALRSGEGAGDFGAVSGGDGIAV